MLTHYSDEMDREWARAQAVGSYGGPVELAQEGAVYTRLSGSARSRNAHVRVRECPSAICLPTSTGCAVRWTSCSVTWSSGSGCRAGARVWPAVDVAYTSDPPRAIVTADLAGVELDELELQIEGHTLILAGRRGPAATDGDVYQQVEIERGPSAG